MFHLCLTAGFFSKSKIIIKTINDQKVIETHHLCFQIQKNIPKMKQIYHAKIFNSLIFKQLIFWHVF